MIIGFGAEIRLPSCNLPNPKLPAREKTLEVQTSPAGVDVMLTGTASIALMTSGIYFTVACQRSGRQAEYIHKLYTYIHKLYNLRT